MLNKDKRCLIVAEIGINHNGDLRRAQKLIKSAHGVGADFVKFQKRTIDIVYTEEELSRPRESVFGSTNGDLKRGLEFGREEYDVIDSYCREIGIGWTASPWDVPSVEFLSQYNVPFIKIASACLTDKELLKAAANGCDGPVFVSTGMADLPLIKRAVQFIEECGGDIGMIYHCNSTYPTKVENLNLRCIETLDKVFPGIDIGYSGHETGVYPSVMAAVLGACSVERHITLNRADWGSDQAASLEIEGFARMVRGIRAWEEARGDGVIRIYPEEIPIAEKLRRVNTL